MIVVVVFVDQVFGLFVFQKDTTRSYIRSSIVIAPLEISYLVKGGGGGG